MIRSGCHKEVGDLEFRIKAPLEGFVLTPQALSTSAITELIHARIRLCSEYSFLNDMEGK
jgi:hypothetical protein